MKFAILLLTVSALCAQEPRVVNARFESHALSGSLDVEMGRLLSGANGPEWAGYVVPELPGNRNPCCWNCAPPSVPAGPVKLEGPTHLLVLFRIDKHAVDKLQVYSADCELDAGGLPFHHITGVSPAESLRYLASIAPERKQAVMAIALHAGPAADNTLDRLAAPSQPERVREDVAFWLGSARGRRGVEALQQMREHDPSDRVRQKVMFGLSVSREPSALELLIDSARNDTSPKVRSQALFWLAHKAGQKETAAISRAIADDPDTQVKKQAVFALRQLPANEGIPLLIQVARTNGNPVVRKQAIFWLGQSGDPRALKFIEEALTK